MGDSRSLNKVTTKHPCDDDASIAAALAACLNTSQRVRKPVRRFGPGVAAASAWQESDAPACIVSYRSPRQQPPSKLRKMRHGLQAQKATAHDGSTIKQREQHPPWLCPLSSSGGMHCDRPSASASVNDSTILSITQINHIVAKAVEEDPFGAESLNVLAQLAGKSTELSTTQISRDQSKSDESWRACAKILRECCDLPVCNDTGSHQVSGGSFYWPEEQKEQQEIVMIHVEDMADAKADADEENEDGDSVLEESPESTLDRTVNSSEQFKGKCEKHLSPALRPLQDTDDHENNALTIRASPLCDKPSEPRSITSPWSVGTLMERVPNCL